MTPTQTAVGHLVSQLAVKLMLLLILCMSLNESENI